MKTNPPAAGYYRHPTIHNETVVFVSDDDLWTVHTNGGLARRLTSGLGSATAPALSPDGEWLAFSAQEEGNLEVYLMPAQGGEARRLTYLGSNAIVSGWTPAGKIIFRSAAHQAFRVPHLYTIDPNGGAPELLPLGPANSISYAPKAGCVIGRNGADPAQWKRYRGGTAGDLWIDPNGKGDFRRLISLKSNLSRPFWIGARIYFLSDHEGVGNIYSCTPDGSGLKQHTQHEDFYVRHPATDGRQIVYHAGADLFVFDTLANTTRKLDVIHASPRTQRARKFVGANKFLESHAPHPQGHLLALTARGKCFTVGNWDGPVLQHNQDGAARYRLPRWLNDGKRLVCVTDAGGEESLSILHADGTTPPQPLQGVKFGHAIEMRVSPNADALALTNHSSELIHIDLKSKKRRVLDKSAWAEIAGFDWSPDGRWLAYSFALSQHTAVLKICDVKGGKTRQVTSAVLKDILPAFDPSGKYLHFLSYREFDPVYDNMHFDLGFPRGIKPCLITLQKNTRSPFLLVPKPPVDKKDEPKKNEKPAAVEIDFDNIESRVLAFPVSEGRYQQIAAIDGKVLWTVLPIEGTANHSWMLRTEPPAIAALEAFDFETQKMEPLLNGVSSFELSADRKTLACRIGNRVRILKAGEKPDEAAAKELPGKKSGWIDLSRVKVSINHGDEWRQMYREAWRLQRDHFWTEDMSNVDWQAVHERYLPLLDRIATRGEFSDLLWEMQGELGTSHAYEIGGDLREPPHYGIGFLGADFTYDPAVKSWRIARIIRGDSWEESKSSPLAAPGLNIREGDTLLAIGGRRLDAATHPNALLVNLSNTEVLCTIGDAKARSPRTLNIKTLFSEASARYRDWSEKNRRIVHERTNGAAGYIHIPDMSARGFAEFHRGFLGEVDRDALIIDVRYNGGGHVSQLLLEKLARQRLAYTLSRWAGIEPYPADSVAGPMVALTNEYAGSDGDIFSHGFKLLKLGPLIGKRTWGGVIGVNPRFGLVDGGLTTQPEYSFWFKDVGWNVENYGTDPDIEVEFRPQDYAANRDPQLERALVEIAKLLKSNPPIRPDFSNRPDLSLANFF